MNALIALGSVLLLALIAWLGVGVAGLETVFGVILPGIALVIFILGVITRVVLWARVPVPFRITTTSGQQKTLPWIEHNRFDNPASKSATFVRMALEVLFFRSLFRNTRAALTGEKNLVYGSSKYLWFGAILFHYCFLVVVLRHLRFFVEPVPGVINFIEGLDSFFEIGLPQIYLTSFGLFFGLLYLLYRRFGDAQVRYMSLFSDYFALFLLLGIALTGGLLRYTPLRADIVQVKELAMGIWTMNPVVVQGASSVFYMHLFLVSTLLFYFPFSKLMHAGGIFMSPTRNLPNDNRANRHVNPWAAELPNNMHTYEEYEEEFANVMKAAGIPLDREHAK